MITKEQAQWAVGGDTGTSSMTIWSMMLGVEMHRPAPPSDPADLGRCIRLLARFPEWKPRLPEIAAKYPRWAPLVREWDHLVELYFEELPSGIGQQCYDAMTALRDEMYAMPR